MPTLKEEIERVDNVVSYNESIQEVVIRGAREFPQALIDDFSDHIQIVNASGNFFSSLQDSFYQIKPRIVFLSNNPNIVQVPPVLSKCIDLRIQAFKNCGNLTYYSNEALAPNLEWNILTCTDLDLLPEEIGVRSPKHRKIALTGNEKLKKLPESLQECKDLELLRYSACGFEQGPANWILNHPSLCWFSDTSNGSHNDVWGYEGEIPIFKRTDLVLEEKFGGNSAGIYSIRDFPGQVAKLFDTQITSDGFARDDVLASYELTRDRSYPQTATGIITATNGDITGIIMKEFPQGYEELGLRPNFETVTRDAYPEDRTFSIPVIYKILESVSGQLSRAHKEGITHGDVYAHNIMANLSTGAATLSDFGAAGRFTREDSQRTKLEVRAFGILVDELLQRTTDEIPTRLEAFKNHCLNPSVKDRATMSHIYDGFRNI